MSRGPGRISDAGAGDGVDADDETAAARAGSAPAAGEARPGRAYTREPTHPEFPPPPPRAGRAPSAPALPRITDRLGDRAADRIRPPAALPPPPVAGAGAGPLAAPLADRPVPPTLPPPASDGVPRPVTVDHDADDHTPPPVARAEGTRPRAASHAGTAADAFAIGGLRSPLVGRDRELAEMEQAVRRAIDFQAPQLLTVVGNQGTGKSRLIDELVERVGGPPVRVFRGRSSPGGPRYGAVARLLRDRFGLGDGMSEDAVRSAVADEVRRVFADNRVGEVMHFLGTFLDFSHPDSPFLRALGENPAQHDEVARTVLRRFLEVDAAQRPLILVFDDLHWADERTLTVLRELGAGLGGTPVVLIACGRPDLTVRFPEWGTGPSDPADHHRIDLRNLEPEPAAAMFRNLLVRCGQVPDEIVEDAVEMTGGNPHFLEQLVRLFLANGTIGVAGDVWTLDPDRAAATDLPISVEEAIQARIAALEAGERAVLERGAVFGNVFWLGAAVSLGRLTLAEPPAEHEWTVDGDAVRREVTAVIDSLVERDYLLRLDAEDSNVAGDVELVFKHNLERELIASSTESGKLARYHRLAAQWLETKQGARNEEQLEFLAQLYERGGDRLQAARCYLAGADKATARYANELAVELYGRALRLLGDDDVIARLGALHNLGAVLDLVGRGDEAAARFREMLHLAWLFDHRAKAGAAHGRLGRIHRKRGEYDDAMEHLRAAHALFEQAADQRGIAGTLDDIGRVNWLRGAYGQALEYHRQALALRRALGDRRSIALSLANIGRVHHDSGGFKAANMQFREALELRREIGDRSGVVESLCDLADVHVADGGAETALELLSEAQRIAGEIGDKLAMCEVLCRLGECRASLGGFEEARVGLGQAIELAGALGHRVAIADASRRLAEVELALGEVESAEDHARHALEISEAVGSRVQVGSAHRVLAEAIAVTGVEPDNAARAEVHFKQAVAILAGMKNELEMARCYRSYANVCERVGKPADAAKLRLRADEIFGRLRGTAGGE